MAKVKNALKLPVYSINFYMEIFYKFIRFETIFWDYDFDNDYDAYMLEFDSNLPVGLFKRLLDTTQHIKAPAISIIRFLISSTDVLHSFALLSLGTKVDAVTGRLNELVVFLGREGLLFGQCSELCGAGHYGMPIVLESLLDIDFDAAMDNDF